MLARIRRFAALLRKTPFHPQWFAYLRETRNLKKDCEKLAGTVLDVGCAEGLARRYLPAAADYIGLDYYSTATNWYGTRPDVFGDAHALPIGSESVDHVLLLDVLEHLADPDKCIAELGRVLKVGGTLTIQVPFLYPVHDAPLDFHRWTRFGLQNIAATGGFEISEEKAIGHPLETAALSANIAISKTVINWIRARNPLALLIALLPVVVTINNSIAWLFAALSREDSLMPYAYRMTWIKS